MQAARSRPDTPRSAAPDADGVDSH